MTPFSTTCSPSAFTICTPFVRSIDGYLSVSPTNSALVPTGVSRSLPLLIYLTIYIAAATIIAATITIKVTFICFFISHPPIHASFEAIYIRVYQKKRASSIHALTKGISQQDKFSLRKCLEYLFINISINN